MLRARNASPSAAVYLLCFAALARGIRDSGVRCDGPDCYDSGVAAQARPDGKLARQHPPKQRSLKEVLLAGGESLSQAAPVPQWQQRPPSSQLENATLAELEQGQAAQGPGSSQAGCKLMGIDCEPLLRFWLIACGLFMLLPLSMLCVFRGRLNLCAEISDEKKAPMPDVTAIRTEEALDESAHFSIRFKDDGLERMWDAHNNKKRVEAGTFTLFLLTGVVIVYQMLRLYWLYHTPCMQPIRWDVQACKFSCFGALLVLLRVNLWKRKPGPKKDCSAEGGGESGQAEQGSASTFHGSQKVFWFALAFYFFFIPAINMPPLTWSCNMLQDSCVASRYDFWFIGQAVRHVDCTLSGPTALQMMITWLLVQPWVMPRYEMIHVCWLWILLVYVGWTVAWTNIADKQSRETYDMYHIFHRTLTLSACTLVSTGVKWGLERTERIQFLRDRKQREASKSMFLILEDMMPMHVIPRMMCMENIADQIDRVSILFVLIADFDQKTKDLQSPAKLLSYLNEKFSQMDEICLRNRVTKIETVKEEYVAAVGVDPEDVIENKAKGHGALLRRLLQASGEIMAMQTDDTKFKMGVHTGPIVAGVMQTTKLPRYRLFGNTINTAARMMQKAPPGQLQFGEDTRQDVPEDMVSQVSGPREVEMKGKGKVQAYIFNPGNDFKKGRTAQERNLLGAVKAMTLASKVVKMRAAVAAASSSKSFMFLRQKTTQIQNTSTSIGDKGPVSRLLDTEVDDRFQSAVGDLLDGETGTPVTAGWQWMSEKKDFTAVMEEEWAQQHHKEHMCKSLAARFGLESVLLLMISASELPSMFQDKVWEHDHALYGGKWRIVVFIYLRGAVIFISIFWWFIADTRMHLIEEKRARATCCFVATYCLSAVLLYFSYDAFVCSDTKDYRDHMQLYKKFQAPHDQIYMLNFLLLFFFISQQHAMLFWPSLSFVFTALFLSYHDHLINAVYPELKFEAPISFLGKLMFIVQAILSTLASYTDEQQSRKRFKQQRAYTTTKQKTENILNTLMPEMVVQEISDNPQITTPSHEFRRATVAQSDLCGFTKLASNKSPQEVVCFMGELFGAFDILTDKHGVYKVETVGDAYIAGVAEFPLTKENSPIRVVLFALDMVREVDKWARQQGGDATGVTCRVGVDYGRCLGGIVGETMQRYHLFGDLLSTMEILESTAPEGRVQISTPLKEEIDSQMADGGLEGMDEEISFTMREEKELRTSKDEVHDYASVRGRTYIVESNKPLRYQDATSL